MPNEPSAAALLAATAEAHDASILGRTNDHLLAVVRLQRPSGKVIAYELTIDASTREPSVREQTPRHLPTFCPNRHINAGGAFCMDFPDVDALRVEDASSAAEWWARLWKFLSLQVTAATLRRWPNKHQWAHGSAAHHQHRSELCARALGPEIAGALAVDRLQAVRCPSRPNFVTLLCGGKRVYSVWRKPVRVTTLRQACPCGSGLTLRRCSDHALRAAELVDQLQAWQRAEDAFWKAAAGRRCCGTLDQCPLMSATTPANSASLVPTTHAA